jgi:hypothetical protein
MVRYSTIAAYTTPMLLRGMQCARLYDHMYLLVSMWTVSVLATVHTGASFCVSVRLCETGVLPTATGGSSAAP